MSERPSYRPWLWGNRWPLVTRWAKDRPERVIAWYAGTSVATAVLIAAAAVANLLPWVIIGGAVLVYGLIDAGIHVPRARHAMRDEARSN